MRNQAPDKSSSWVRRMVRWPAFLVANIALFLLIGVSTVRETYRGWSVDHEIKALEAQADQLEGRKLKLMELTESLSSPERVEMDARSRLGWRKPGEQVVVVSGVSNVTTTVDFQNAPVPPEPDQSTNPQRWLNYFFKSSSVH